MCRYEGGEETSYINGAQITRRRLLKIGSGLISAAPIILTRAVPTLAQTAPIVPVLEPTRRPFGRALRNNASVRTLPSVNAGVVRSLKWGEVVSTLGEAIGVGPTTYNPIWYKTADGWIHSSMVQPSEDALNPPLPAVDPVGMWGEITVPTAQVRIKPDATAAVVDRYYYGCVLRVRDIVAGTDGAPYYRIGDGNGGGGYYMAAAQVRPIASEEFTPLSPDVPMAAKRIDVDLTKQIATAYEDDQPVFSARIATGATFRIGGELRSYRTIPGSHRIFMKIPGQRMTGGVGETDRYNLPGVSWVSYFTGSGIAFHGAYWHNDYGKPRSHGCVNMLPEDAKWVFRWTMPQVDAAQAGFSRVAQRTDGTLIRVF
jgi:lipoprotein-anchoring transpeptidase ErfK/SrfK